MRISEALAEETPLDVHFPGGAVLHIRYRPSSYTVADLDTLEREGKKDISRVLRVIRDTVTWWDLEDDDGNAIPLMAPITHDRVVTTEGDAVESPTLSPEEERQARIASDPMAQKVALSILTKILRAINEDQSAGE